ncbi:MAG: hypothetical protein A3F68_06070 [Acidobacteria bacterium RIFCSPLOWO2_12_FULL_54_10]|nr:MAG: hypothetical protein A3F68_06070 [Acidobacteria bacterium RIFCSPLOWO2_12_FULL_54_10]
MKSFLSFLGILAIFMAASLYAQKPAPLSIERQGWLFAGGQYSTVNGRQILSGHLYAEFQIPSRKTHPYPIVMVTGGGQTGTNYTGTPDGREGWAQYFLRQGYAVYVTDQVGRGRAATADLYGPEGGGNMETIQQRFTTVEDYKQWPTAHLHTQFPGKAAPGNPAFDQFASSQVPSIQDFAIQQKLNTAALIALLDKIGPAIIVTHSQSGTFGWPVADARPNLVKAVIALEPNGPPFYNITNTGAPDWFRDGDMQRPWGLTAEKLTYSPPTTAASELAIEQQTKADGPDLARCWLQKSPARQLPKLQNIPILILTAEASYHAPYDHCTYKYLEQSGVKSTWIKLADLGIRGNGHMLMLEKNNMEIADVIAKWLAKAF